ncbi:ATP-binding cassette domain-containing protein [Pseudolysinimonas kribbensis]|uniref:ABC transporter ATP-binding protein n=1 Tax=Pseudolysinimonas kribbensis TaxID=433641 RepID=A0ABQ6K2I8_9MICO|nr:ATP-binding cassette domain-containing protein [Pseudolysinimonas kribbensis]GMA94826.1 ABC transporter ATP-binding protein [Pseudolysinimonas kribbensis]
MSALLAVDQLRVRFGTGKRATEVLHGVSFEIAPSETLGLVGESGSGKTTIGRTVLGLVKAHSGAVSFDGRDITSAGRRERRALAKDIQVVFQDPYSSLNPAMAIGDILSEPLIMQGVSRRDARARVRTLLDQVGLPSDATDRRPQEFSGGQRQRVAIARALAPEPRLIVCDEPVSALDLTTQARVLDLFAEIQQRTGVAYLFISHDLAVVRHISDRACVLYRGDIVETGQVDDVISRPTHAYTRRLILAAPVADPDRQAERRRERRRLLDLERSTEAVA